MPEATTAVPNTTGTAQLPQDIGSIISLITGLTGSPDANKIADSADPWAPNRQQYMDQLNAFMKDPGSIFTDPAFQAAQKVGAENISRQFGAAGMGASGNRLADLFSFGQSSALDFEKQRFNELSNLAGVNVGSPVAAAGLKLGNLQTQGSNLANGLAGVLPLLASLFGLNTGGGLAGLAGSIGKLFGGGGGGIDISKLLDQGGITAGGLDTGGTLGDIMTPGDVAGVSGPGDFGSVLDGFFQGGSGDIFQMTDVIGG
jgi:hypothetical protein